jgi:hypothetical protein
MLTGRGRPALFRWSPGSALSLLEAPQSSGLRPAGPPGPFFPRLRPGSWTGLTDGATPEMLTKLPSAARSLCSALSGPRAGSDPRRRVHAAPRDRSEAHARQHAIRFGPHTSQNRRPGLGLVRGDQGRVDHAGDRRPLGRHPAPRRSSLDLAFLAPDIGRSIVEGRQPPTFTADRLIKSRHRMLWPDQRAWISAI